MNNWGKDMLRRGSKDKDLEVEVCLKCLRNKREGSGLKWREKER